MPETPCHQAVGMRSVHLPDCPQAWYFPVDMRPEIRGPHTRQDSGNKMR